MPDIRWRQVARDDLQSIIEYIASDNPAAAMSSWEDIEDMVSRLPENPRAHRIGRVAGTRELVAHRHYVAV